MTIITRIERKGGTMLGFLLGLFVGGIVGVFVTALCVAARRDDDKRGL